jgi:hypothetical protein
MVLLDFTTIQDRAPKKMLVLTCLFSGLFVHFNSDFELNFEF